MRMKIKWQFFQVHYFSILFFRPFVNEFKEYGIQQLSVFKIFY
jgi:hypothetical protein